MMGPDDMMGQNVRMHFRISANQLFSFLAFRLFSFSGFQVFRFSAFQPFSYLSVQSAYHASSCVLGY
jgi:hypothetical protein